LLPLNQGFIVVLALVVYSLPPVSHLDYKTMTLTLLYLSPWKWSCDKKEKYVLSHVMQVFIIILHLLSR